MEKTYDVRIKQKKDTIANWTAKNPLLLDGEVAYVVMEDGEIKRKIGDGKSQFSELPYTDEALRTYIADTFVTKALLENILNDLNFGFAADEDAMQSVYHPIEILNASVENETLTINSY